MSVLSSSNKSTRINWDLSIKTSLEFIDRFAKWNVWTDCCKVSLYFVMFISRTSLKENMILWTHELRTFLSTLLLILQSATAYRTSRNAWTKSRIPGFIPQGVSIWNYEKHVANFYKHFVRKETLFWCFNWVPGLENVLGELHALAVLSPGKERPVPNGRKLDGPQSQYGSCGEKNS